MELTQTAAPKEKKFRFWMPLDEIKKGKDKDGKDVMVLGGIASTNRTDTDGESLDPSGFDISYLKEKGVVNWNHNKSPEAVIGEPSKAMFKKGNLYIESTLYPDSKLAKDVYALAKTLKANSTSRRLGYSIEGKALERDINDPNQVTKAMITGVAVTICPKNPDSIIDIIKGEFHEFNDTVKPEDNPNIDELFLAANGGKTTNIVDIVREDGMRVVVDADYNIKISKANETEEEDDDTKTEKDLNTSSGAALVRESVEGVPKRLCKGEVFEKIFDTLGVIELSKANLIYETLNNLTMATKKNNDAMSNITEDVLEKALSKLGDLTKGEGAESQDEQITTGKGGKMPKQGDKGAFKKSAKKDDEEEMEDEEEEDDEPVEKPAKKKIEKSAKIKKDEDADDDMEKGGNDALAKAIIAGFGSLGVVMKGMNDKLNAIAEKQDLVEKGMSDLNDLVDDIGSQAPAPKSTTKAGSKPVERNFNKGMEDEFEKGEQQEAPANQLSVSKNKTQVLNLLDKCTFEKGFDNEFAGALTRFENTGAISGNIVTKVKAATGISLVA